MKRPIHLHMESMEFARPFDFSIILDLMVRLSGYTRRSSFAIEIRLIKDKVGYHILSDHGDTPYLHQMIQASNPVSFHTKSFAKRNKVDKAFRLKIHHSHFALKTDNVANFTRTLLGLCQNLRAKEEIIFQLLIGKARSPRPLPKDLSHLTASWWQEIWGNVPKLSPESDKQIREKLRQAQFQADLRIGVRSESIFRQNELAYQTLGAFKILESSGVKMSFSKLDVALLNSVHFPWRFPLVLSASELACFWLTPFGDEELAGIDSIHPKNLLPPLGYKVKNERIVATSLSATPQALAIPPVSALRHTHILGGTGVGKSTLMLQLILQDISAGRGTVVIDPKGDLIQAILARFPKHRDQDLVILDPTQHGVTIGLNPFEMNKFLPPQTVADMLLNLFEDLFADNWGVRTIDVLAHSLHSLAQIKSADLTQLPRLLTDTAFRNSLLQDIHDPLILQFWEGYSQLSPASRDQLISPVMNKLRRILLNPETRRLLATSSTKFNLMEVFTQRKILLVNLNRGVIGSENARFIGTILTNYLYQLTLRRSEIPPQKRHFVPIYIDELGQFLKLPVDLEDALSMSRSMGVGYILANQYMKQLPAHLRSSIQANCHNKIVFNLSSDEAHDMAKQAPSLEAKDFMNLPPFQVYARLPIFNGQFQWLSGQTLPAGVENRPVSEVYAQSLNRYGEKPKEKLPPSPSNEPTPTFGRQKRERRLNAD